MCLIFLPEKGRREAKRGRKVEISIQKPFTRCSNHRRGREEEAEEACFGKSFEAVQYADTIRAVEFIHLNLLDGVW